MLEKPLNQNELEVLDVLRQLHAKLGPVERTHLSVEVRGRGLEFGRAIARLMTLGLVEEITLRPFFLRRLFGARTAILLQPTPAGLAQGQRPAEPDAIDPTATESTAAVPTDAPLIEMTAPVPDAPIAEPLPEPQTPTDLAPAPDFAPDAEPTAEAIPTVEPEEAPKPAAPKAKAAKPKSPRPRPAPITAFTEDLGGTPLPSAAPMLPPAMDPAMLEGLRETLSVIGMDLTQAGEALAANRIAKGATPAEALSQVVLFAFGHAVQQDLYRGGEVADLGLRDYAAEVMREIEKIRDAGELADAPFERDMRQLWALLEDTPERAALVKDLLSDPVGGAAPTAVLPEELRRSEEE
ncbi:MAG: hypothetical protein ACOH2H_15810 [Cypionkella sp.]